MAVPLLFIPFIWFCKHRRIFACSLRRTGPPPRLLVCSSMNYLLMVPKQFLNDLAPRSGSPLFPFTDVETSTLPRQSPFDVFPFPSCIDVLSQPFFPPLGDGLCSFVGSRLCQALSSFLLPERRFLPPLK